MNSIEILNTVNVVAVATSNLRYCYTFSELDDACRIVRAHLESIRFSISRELYASLDDALRDTSWSQYCNIKGYEA